LFHQIVKVFANSNDVTMKWRAIARENYWRRGSGPWMTEKAWLRRKIVALKPLYFTLGTCVKPKQSTLATQFQVVMVHLTNLLLFVEI